MDEISILKNRLAYFSNRISYELTEEYEIDESDLLDEQVNEDEKERVIEYDEPVNEDEKTNEDEKEQVKIIKNLIKIGVIDFNRDGPKIVSTLTNIPQAEVKKLVEKYYDKFEKIQQKVYEKREKRVQKEKETKINKKDEQIINIIKNNMKYGLLDIDKDDANKISNITKIPLKEIKEIITKFDDVFQEYQIEIEEEKKKRLEKFKKKLEREKEREGRIL